MRFLLLSLLVLLGLPALAADYDYTPWPDDEQESASVLLAQQNFPGQGIQAPSAPSSGGGQSGGQSSGGSGGSGGGQSGGSGGSGVYTAPPYKFGMDSHPGRYCCRHCRFNEIPCGGDCIPKGGKKSVCMLPPGCACPGKP